MTSDVWCAMFHVSFRSSVESCAGASPATAPNLDEVLTGRTQRPLQSLTRDRWSLVSSGLFGDESRKFMMSRRSRPRYRDFGGGGFGFGVPVVS